MQVNISARHLELTQPIADYIQKKVDKCQRFFDHIVWAQVIISVEKIRQVAEIIIHARNTTFRAKEESTDLYSAIDLAIDKMDKQLKKHKEKTKKLHKHNTAQSMDVLEAAPQRSLKNLIKEVKRFEIKPLSVIEAIDEMEQEGGKFYMFMNSKTSQINVVYLKDADSYGLLEPEI